MIIQPRPFNLRKTLTVLAALGVDFYFYFQRPPPLQFWRISGAAWSPYVIKFTDNQFNTSHIQQLKTDIDALLAEINQQMSTYIPDSEISRLNRNTETSPQVVSIRFAEILNTALILCRETDGAFNPTLDPLINVWGFGHQGPRREPSEAELLEARSLIGCDKVMVTEQSQVQKVDAQVQLNLNAITEGWAVDEVAMLLEQKGITNYFVEIGGEVYAKGLSERMRTWRVGIDRPVESAQPGEHFDLIVELDGLGLATSGDYRNFHADEAGRKISHIMDPRTGQPATSSLASVSVLAPTCGQADALATALFVMGTQDGLAWVDAHPEIEAAFIDHQPDGSFRTTFSRGFEQFVLKETNPNKR